jgi:hypothetical protein
VPSVHRPTVTPPGVTASYWPCPDRDGAHRVAPAHRIPPPVHEGPWKFLTASCSRRPATRAPPTVHWCCVDVPYCSRPFAPDFAFIFAAKLVCLCPSCRTNMLCYGCFEIARADVHMGC